MKSPGVRRSCGGAGPGSGGGAQGKRAILIALAVFWTNLLPTPSPAAAAPTPTGDDRPALWILAAGVSRYADPKMNLRYADVDADAIAGELAGQSGGALYRGVQSLVLRNEDVTRESVFTAMQRFLREARYNDVVVVFLAGHGVQDRATQSYYFLPHAATTESMITTGIRMSDFDELVRAILRNVGRVVVMLDTCHAGAFRLGPGTHVRADDLASRISAGGGLYLLAATNPGEDSIEQPELQHGTFTAALLEGLRGKADPDHDALISVSDLFSYVAQRVPELTDGRQHPYHKIEGSALLLTAVSDATRPEPPSEAARRRIDLAKGATRAIAPETLNAVAVMDFENLRATAEHQWIGRALRVALNTELSKVRELNVYSPELLDWTSKNEGTGILRTANGLGVQKMISGSFAVVGEGIRVDVNIIDPTTGKNLPGAAEHVEGRLDKFFDLQNTLTTAVLRRLEVEVARADGAAAGEPRNESVNALRLLLNAERIGGPTPAKKRDKPQSRSLPWWLPLFASEARAESPDPTAAPADAGRGGALAEGTQREIETLIEEYRAAQETKDLDRLARVFESFSDEHRRAVRDYLDTVDALQIRLTDLKMTPRGEHVEVSFTRHDRFVDRKTGETVPLEVRLTKLVVRKDGRWCIALIGE